MGRAEHRAHSGEGFKAAVETLRTFTYGWKHQYSDVDMHYPYGDGYDGHEWWRVDFQ